MTSIFKKNKAVFIDRDGTIARDVPYCSKPEDFELLPDVIEGICALNQAGYKIVIITNQSGVGRGYFTEEMLGRIHEKMIDDFKKGNARIDGIYYCPHHPSANCDCRKPKPTMFLRAAKDLNIDFNHSYMVGDMSQDIEAGQKVGCKTVFVEGGSQPADTPLDTQPDYFVGSFAEAVEWILADTGVPE